MEYKKILFTATLALFLASSASAATGYNLGGTVNEDGDIPYQDYDVDQFDYGDYDGYQFESESVGDFVVNAWTDGSGSNNVAFMTVRNAETNNQKCRSTDIENNNGHNVYNNNLHIGPDGEKAYLAGEYRTSNDDKSWVASFDVSDCSLNWQREHDLAPSDGEYFNEGQGGTVLPGGDLVLAARADTGGGTQPTYVRIDKDNGDLLWKETMNTDSNEYFYSNAVEYNPATGNVLVLHEEDNNNDGNDNVVLKSLDVSNGNVQSTERVFENNDYVYGERVVKSPNTGNIHVITRSQEYTSDSAYSFRVTVHDKDDPSNILDTRDYDPQDNGNSINHYKHHGYRFEGGQIIISGRVQQGSITIPGIWKVDSETGNTLDYKTLDGINPTSGGNSDPDTYNRLLSVDKYGNYVMGGYMRDNSGDGSDQYMAWMTWIDSDTLERKARWYYNAESTGGSDYSNVYWQGKAAGNTLAKIRSDENGDNDNEAYFVSFSFNNPPTIGAMECKIDGAWKTCSDINTWNANWEEIRADYSDPEGDSFDRANATTAQEYDDVYRLNDYQTTNITNNHVYWNPSDIVLDDSGNWNATLEVFDTQAPIPGKKEFSFSIPWGTLSLQMNQPDEDIVVRQNDTFEMSGTLTCEGGECASQTQGGTGGAETVEVWADPLETGQKINLANIQGRIADEQVQFTTDLPESYIGESETQRDNNWLNSVTRFFGGLVPW